jgi:dihydrofolate reductase
MGRATYLDMAAYWPSSTEPFAAPMNEVPKAVFSKTLSETPWGETRVLRGDLAEEVEALEMEPGKVVLAHGGASFARALAASGLVDEYRLRVHPVALGSGLPVFSGLTGRLRLALVDARTFPNGVAVHTYRPV